MFISIRNNKQLPNQENHITVFQGPIKYSVGYFLETAAADVYLRVVIDIVSLLLGSQERKFVVKT